MSRDKKFKRLIRLVNWYPPFLFSGIKVVEHSDDFKFFKVRLKVTWYNRNLIGTAFGGSLYSMCDPFFMFILIANLGEDYVVWDKYASIDFVKPGKGVVYATFSLSQDEIQGVKELANKDGKHVVEFPCEVKDEAGNVIASLKKGVYVKRKDFQKART